MRRVCSAILKGSSILMVRHIHNGKDYWTLPGGGIEVGESPEVAAAREVFEETGLRVSIGKIIYQENGEVCFFAERLEEREPILGSDPELSQENQMIREVAWRPLTDLVDDCQVSRVLSAIKGS